MTAGDAQQRTLACPLCANNEFSTEESRQESRWGLTSHRMTLKVCTQCTHVLHFYDAHSWFDVD